MGYDKIVDSTQLNSDLTSIANAIRTKTGGSSQLLFPTEFVTAINSIVEGLSTSSPIIHVIAPIGSTVRVIYTGSQVDDITPDAHPCSDGITADYYAVPKYRSSRYAYSVTASLNGNNSGTSIYVSDVCQYNVSFVPIGDERGLLASCAILHVAAPIGSTVAVSKSGGVVKSLGPENAHNNSDEKNADYYFSISSESYGEWTVTASKSGELSVSRSVIVSSAIQYDVIMQFYVPIEYQAIEYLETQGGSCYFDTGIDVSSANIETEVIFNNTSATTYNGARYLFGTSNGYVMWANKQYRQWTFGYYNANTENLATYDSSDTIDHHVLYNALGGSIVLDGEPVLGARERRPASASYIRLYIGRNYNASNGVSSYGRWRYKRFIVTDTSTETVLGDFRPCYRKADLVPGFWDDISKTFVLNAGTQAPIVGPDV